MSPYKQIIKKAEVAIQKYVTEARINNYSKIFKCSFSIITFVVNLIW